MRIKCIAQGHYCRCQQIRTGDLTIESPWSYPLSHNSSSKGPLTICSEMLAFSENNQNIEMFGVPPNNLPYVMYIIIICHWAILHYNMPFKTIATFFEFTKLSCGFKRRCFLTSSCAKLSLFFSSSPSVLPSSLLIPLIVDLMF